MKLNIYVIFDAKAKLYNTPFYQLNNAVAHRTAESLVSDPTTDIARNPEDFTLFCLGSYDDNTAEFDLLATPEAIIKFHELTPRNLEPLTAQEKDDLIKTLEEDQ